MRSAFHRRFPLLRAALVVFLLGFSGLASAQQAERPFATVVAGWTRTLNQLEVEAARPNLIAAEIDRMRGDATAVRNDAQAAAAQAADELKAARTLLAPLEPKPQVGPDGKALPPPTEPPPGETPELRAQRQKLQADVALLDNRVRTAELVAARADLLVQQLSRARGDVVTRTLLRKGPSPFALATWGAAGAELQGAIAEHAAGWRAWLVTGPQAFWKPLADVEGQVGALAGLVIVAMVWGGLASLRRRHGRLAWRGEGAPDYRVRLTAALLDGVGMVAGPVLAIVVVLALLGSGEHPDAPWRFVMTLGVGATIALLIHGLSETALAPHAPRWRLLDFSDESAERLSTRLQRYAWINTGMTTVMAALLGESLDRPALGALCAVVLSAVGVFASLPVLRRDAWRARDVEGRTPMVGGGWWTFGRGVVRLVMLSALIAALVGRPSLAAHIYFSMFLSAAAIGVALVLHGLARDLIAAVTAPDTYAGRWARRMTGQAEDAPLGGQLLLLLAVDVLLMLIMAAVLPTIWGADTDDLGDWLWKLLTGIKIGDNTISLMNVAIALGVFVGTVFVVGLLRRGVRDRLLPSIQVQDALRYSIDAGMNYAGIALAGIFAITALGVDFSNLALIIGALSVGIGLGLQSVANNTISGIILLLERPIKVGDWVIVGEHEGTVKRINIRATEIETFRRATVIVPNADLLQKAVVNWTYADHVGRIEVPIVVAIWSDVAAVEAALLAAAADCKNLALTPRPHVLFRRIGDRGLEFELRAYVGNVANSLAARNALNRAVVDRLRNADIRLIAEEPPLQPEPAPVRHPGAGDAPAAPVPQAPKT